MKILIIKLGADGDVLRTLPIAKALKKKCPVCEIDWITRGDIAELIEENPYVNKVFRLPYKNEESYDEAYNFDVEKEALEIIDKVKAGKKYGFKKEGEYAAAYNLGAEYYLNTMFDDELKKSNRKTYQEMMFEAAELNYEKEDYEIILNEKDIRYAKEFAEKNEIRERLIGIHMGASSRWPSKAWHESKVKEFIVKAERKGFGVILFGGPNEAEKHGRLIEELKSSGVKIYRNNPLNTKREFASLVTLCEAMVCSDSFSLHVSLALKKKTIGLFFCTSPWEVEGYNLLEKIISPMLKDFFPEKSNLYDESLVNSISVESVLEKI